MAFRTLVSGWLRARVVSPIRSRRSASRRRRPRLEELEVRLAPANITWTNPNGGDWDTASNWSGNAVPGPGDDATIGDLGPDAAIFHGTSATDSVHSITSNTIIILSAGTLSVSGTLSDTGVDGGVYLSGGTLADATIASGTTIQTFQKATGTLQDVTVAGSLVLPDGSNGKSSSITVAGAGLTLQGGSVTINYADSLVFSGTQTLGGSGTVTFNGGGSITDSGTGNVLTIAAGVTVNGDGGGTIDAGTAALDNLGTLSDALASFTQPPLTVNGTNWVNDGTIEGLSGGAVFLSGSWTNDAPNPNSVPPTNPQILANGGSVDLSGTWSNSGTISLTNSGALYLDGTFTLAELGTLTRTPITTGSVNISGTLDLTGQTLDTSTGAWTLYGGTIQGGTVTDTLLTTSGGGTTSTLDGVMLAGTLDIIDGGLANVSGGSLTLANGSINLDNTYGTLNFDGTQTLGVAAGDTGTVTFAHGTTGTGQIIDSGTASDTLTIAAGITIQGGNGTLHTGAAAFDNQGLISANEIGNPLNLGGSNWTNDGVIQAISGGSFVTTGSWTNNAGAQISENNTTFTLGGSWTNNGTIQVTSGTAVLGGTGTHNGLLSISGGTVNLAGTISVGAMATCARDSSSPGTINLTGTLNLTGQTLDSSAAPLILDGGTIKGGTVNAALVAADYKTNKLQDVTLASTLTVAAAGGPTIDVLGAGLTLQGGSISLGGGNGGMVFSGSQTLGGTGTVNFNNSAFGNAGIIDSGAGNTLTIGAGVTIDGSFGYIDTGTAALDNQGTIDADSTDSGQILTVNGTNWVNDGTIEGSNGGTIVMEGSWTNNADGQMDPNGGTVKFTGAWSNNGTINVSNGGILDLGGNLTLASLGTLNRSPLTTGTVALMGTLTLTGQTLDGSTGPWTLSRGTIVGGTVSDALLTASGTLSTLQDVVLSGSLDIMGAGFPSVEVLSVDVPPDGLTLQGGSIVVEGNAGNLIFNGNQTLAGNGTVTFGTNGYGATISDSGGGTLTIANQITIQGGNDGTIDTGSGVLDNQGTINANSTYNGGNLTVNGTNWLNDGTIEATNGSSITLQGSWTNDVTGQIIANGSTVTLKGTWSNTGVINSMSATVNLEGTFTTADLGTFNVSASTVNLTGTLNNMGGTLAYTDPSGVWNITGTIDGGSVALNVLYFYLRSNSVLNAVTLEVDSPCLLEGGTISGGTVTSAAGTGLMATARGGTLAGINLAGTLFMSSSLLSEGEAGQVTVTGGLTLSGGVIDFSNAADLTFQANQSLSGTGTVTFNDETANNGIAVTSGTTLTISSGVLVQGNSGVVGLGTGQITNQGTIEATGGATLTVENFTNYASGSLTVGTWEAVSNSTLRLIGANITTNAAAILLDGASARVYSNTGTTSALTSFATNAAGGSFTIQNGANFTSSQAFTNAGRLHANRRHDRAERRHSWSNGRPDQRARRRVVRSGHRQG
jgi:hypothetical protein